MVVILMFINATLQDKQQQTIHIGMSLQQVIIILATMIYLQLTKQEMLLDMVVTHM